MNVWLQTLRLTHYRNVTTLDLRPSATFNIFSGLNAQGKTNLLESISLLSTGRILRGTRVAQAVQEGAADATVFGQIGPLDDEIMITLHSHGRKRVTVNGSALPRGSDLMGRLPSVCFSSADLAIVTGEPSDRRHFLDTELSQIYPTYLKHLTLYKRALDQRNVLLRRAQDVGIDEMSFDVWERPMEEHGSEIRRFRREWMTTLAEAARFAHAKLGSGETLLMKTEERDLGDLGCNLRESRSADVYRGSSSCGPHRDDLTIEVGGRLARQFGSQGQQRTAVIAIKLAVLEEAKRAFGYPPLLLLDDIFSDLDYTRRQALVETAREEGGQVFLTCTEAEQAGVELLGQSRVFRVRSGVICEA